MLSFGGTVAQYTVQVFFFFSIRERHKYGRNVELRDVLKLLSRLVILNQSLGKAFLACFRVAARFEVMALYENPAQVLLFRVGLCHTTAQP